MARSIIGAGIPAADANVAAHIVGATDKAHPEPLDEPVASWAAPCLTFAAVLLGGMALAWWLA